MMKRLPRSNQLNILTSDRRAALIHYLLRPAPGSIFNVNWYAYP